MKYTNCGTVLSRKLSYLILTVFILFPLDSAPANAEKTDMDMFYNEEEQVVSPTRHPKNISYVAENIAIVSAQEIEMMNAHTLSDVLNTINGVQVLTTGGPGSLASALIQGASTKHVSVFIDGVMINLLAEHTADVGTIPVQNIARIEIIKGPASAAWGSALGGVINVITKTGSIDNKIGGSVSGSYGQKNTSDYRAEVHGSAGNITYYLNGGLLNSDGFRARNDFSGNNLYGKIAVAPSSDTKFQITVNHNENTYGITELKSRNLGFDGYGNVFFATMSLSHMIKKDLNLNLSMRTAEFKLNQFIEQLSTGITIDSSIYKESGYGFSGQLAWQDAVHSLVLGVDYDERKTESNKIMGGVHNLRKYGLFLNDTILLGKFTITPSIRYDSAENNSDFVSPSIGITYGLAHKTLLRITASRGFNTPPITATFGTSIFHVASPSLRVEKVTSYQAGVESAALSKIWVKASLFRHELIDTLDTEKVSDYVYTTVNSSEKQIHQGAEFEVKAAPMPHVVVSVSAMLAEAKGASSGEQVYNSPRRTYDCYVQYDKRPYKILLKGRYIDWNAWPANGGKYGSLVVDLNLIRNVPVSNGRTMDLYFNAHNLFNGSQYAISVYKNPMRWLEAGIRFKF